MPTAQNDIIQQLQREILPLQGYKPPPSGLAVDVGLGPIQAAFPNASFPTGAIHELISELAQDAAATCVFVGGLLGSLMANGGVCLWVGSQRTLFPPALKSFGVNHDRVIFVVLHKE